jgi:hypothetical protein
VTIGFSIASQTLHAFEIFLGAGCHEDVRDIALV